MILLENWIQGPVARAVGWTIFHSLWQGALVALALAIALAAVRSPRARYAAGCLAMLAMLAGFGLTFGILAPQHRVTRTARSGRIPAAPPLDEQTPARTRARPADVMPWLALFWIAGVFIFHLRGIAAWGAARRMSRRGVCAAPDPWQQRLNRLGARLRLSRSVALLESCMAEVPMVIGHLRPVVLLPVGLLAGLPVEQIEAILLHELAHIRRFDYLINLLQSSVEGLLFYHPAIWWLSAVIRAERENCCDDVVVAASGDAYGYAAALAALEQNRSTARQAALAASGGTLVKRISRLLDQPEGPRAALTPAFSAAILAITATLTLAAWQSPASPAPPKAYSAWLNEDVAYIITEPERAAFQFLQTDEEREQFIKQFWLRRDPTPGTPENEFQEEHYRRIASANSRYATANAAGWKTDRGRIYIMYGPPDEIESHPVGGPGATYPFEDWLYHHIDNVGDNVIIEFVDPDLSGEYRMAADKVPPEKDVPGPISHVGATALPVGNGTALVSIPLSAYGGHRVNLYGRIAGPDHQVKAVFQDSMEGPGSVYSKLVQLSAGSYRLNVLVKDLVTGALANDEVQFDVK